MEGLRAIGEPRAIIEFHGSFKEVSLNCHMEGLAKSVPLRNALLSEAPRDTT